MKDPDLALIGCGYWGRNLARNFYQLKVLRAIVEPDEHLRQTMELLYPDVELYSCIESVLESDKIRKIAIATPSITHYELAKRALSHQKDLFVEKPLALSFMEGQELSLLAKQNHLILMVGHILQYHPVFVTLKRLVQVEGIVGNIHCISSSRVSTMGARQEGLLWDLAPHDLSMILSLLPQGPIDYTLIRDRFYNRPIDELLFIRLLFPKEVTAHVHLSLIHPKKEQRFIVMGDEGSLLFDDLKPWNEKLQFYKDKLVSSISIEPKEPLTEECLHFLECCRDRTVPRTGGEEVLRVLNLLSRLSEGNPIESKTNGL